jgi:penicillin-binding protein 1A
MPAKRWGIGALFGLWLALPAGAQGTGEPWRIIDLPQSSLIYARDRTIMGEVGRQLRTSVPLASLSKFLPQAFIAVEDRRFYQHDGVDVVGFLGTLKDALSGRVRGGSTITMQLVGNMHPDVVSRRDRSIDRKLREQAAAREMERHYTKQQILEAYLNTIEFGHGWYGIDAAARHYFGVPAGRVTLAEAATLAALPKAPPAYDPIRHPERAKLRRDLILTLMAHQGMISAVAADLAKREPVVTAPDARTGPAPYAVDAATTEAQHDGVPVLDGGYRVYTTLDPALEQDAVSALAEGVAAVEARPGYSNPKQASDNLEGMVVAVDPASGEVRAIVGGRNYLESPFDRAVSALRQPGSAFKPVVYAGAVTDSIPANAIVYDTAVAIPLEDGTVYRPEDDDKQFLGPMTMREALTRSRNAVAVQLAERVGLDSVIALARRLGITTSMAPYPATAIGASAVRPIELVGAYAPFDNGGLAVTPHLLMRIDDRAGRTVWASPPALGPPALDSNVAFIVRDMMRDVVERGTAASVRRTLPATVPAAGKTGTTNDNTDVWFVGMTPELVAGVWLGFDQPRPIATGAAGGTFAAPIWARMMATYYLGREPGTWMPPATLISADLDRSTGALADATTPAERRYTEYFLPGTEPAELRFDPRSVVSDGPITLP